MSDVKDNLIHGHAVDENGHHGVGDYMKAHMDERQMEQLAHTARHSPHGAFFTAHVDGENRQYRYHDGKIHKA